LRGVAGAREKHCAQSFQRWRWLLPARFTSPLAPTTKRRGLKREIPRGEGTNIEAFLLASQTMPHFKTPLLPFAYWDCCPPGRPRAVEDSEMREPAVRLVGYKPAHVALKLETRTDARTAVKPANRFPLENQPSNAIQNTAPGDGDGVLKFTEA